MEVVDLTIVVVLNCVPYQTVANVLHTLLIELGTNSLN